MTRKLPIPSSLFSLATSLALAGGASLGQAQSLPAPYTFDTGAPSWTALWWLSGEKVYWDKSQDADHNPNSGSVRCEMPLNGGDGGCWGCVEDGWAWDQNIVIDNTTGIAGSLSCDIRIDPSSAPTKDGDYGWMHLQLEDNVTWSMTDLGSVNLPLSATNWTHISLPIKAGTPAHFFGYVITVWGGNYTNSMAFNMDNLVLGTPPAKVQLLAPTFSNGLMQFTVTNLVANKSYSIQASSNMTNWIDIYTFFATDTSFSMFDSPDPSMTQQFYRVSYQP